MLLFLGCADPDGSRAPPPDTVGGGESTFAGIERASWDGSDGLVAAWSAMTGAASYTVEASDWQPIGDDPIPTADTVSVTVDSGTSAPLSGLADGAWDVRVIANDGEGESQDGGRSLRLGIGATRLALLSETLVDGGARTLDGDGAIVAVGGGGSDDGRVSIFDISDPTAPTLTATLPDLGEVTDVAVGGGALYVATDTALHPDATVSVRIYDLSDPTAPALLSSIGADEDWAHTVTWADGVIYLASGPESRLGIWDVSEPATPTNLAEWSPPPPGGVHDQTVQDSRIYVAYGEALAILDGTNPSDPGLLSLVEADWDAPFVHNLWPTADGDTLAVSEEAVGGPLRVYDISDLSQPVLADTWLTDADHSIHNVAVRGDTAFAAWYVDGLVVLDLSDPYDVTELDRYDTYTSGDESSSVNDGGFAWPNVSGATNVWPFGDDVVALSDQQRGLLLFDWFPVEVAWGDPFARQIAR